MIASDFIYCRPDTLKEAATVYAKLAGEGKSPVYYGGGSEIITMSRAGSIAPGAVIDLKSIPECKVLEQNGAALMIGGAVTLRSIRESKLFPLLGAAAGRIADHTNQCRITLGGNLCGTIRYREASLPLMLTDAEVVLYGSGGERKASMLTIFRERMRLLPGEFICGVNIDARYLYAPFMHIKKTANEKIDYPLVNVSAIIIDGRIRAAFSGLCAFPFRSMEIEAVLNDKTASISSRIDKAADLLPAPALADAEGLSQYRIFVLKNTLCNVLERLRHDFK
ncbi:MAG: FAD binding domain-containing protein [Oscillospiraceae bacterium]|nr:FAD binding domain-containing protein [Oscillospiraceae bacterium]